MPKHIDLMRKREEGIYSLLEFISRKTGGFSKPRLTMIGGYALRAYIPFTRYTRDCDFVIKKEGDWKIDKIIDLLSKRMNIEKIEKREIFPFLSFFPFS